MLGGIAVLIGALTAAFKLLLLFVALPFAAAGCLVWYQGTGRLAARIRREATANRSDTGAGLRRRTPGRGPTIPAGLTPGHRRHGRGRDAGPPAPASGTRRERSPTPGGRADDRWRRRRSVAPVEDRTSEREAYGVFGVAPGSDEATVREAYRDRVKETHPDTEDGDEEAFKRVAAVRAAGRGLTATALRLKYEGATTRRCVITGAGPVEAAVWHAAPRTSGATCSPRLHGRVPGVTRPGKAFVGPVPPW